MIEINLMGRRGNQMFQYAVTRTVAERKGYNFHINPTRIFPWESKDLFNCSMGKKDGDIKQIFYDTNQQEFNPAIYNVEDFTLLWGYFQSEKYFDHAKVRQWFRPVIQITPPFPYDDYCYVHFRGTDYNVFPWNLYQLPISYYENAMAKILEINPNLKFVFVTDDRQEAKKRFPNVEVISGTGATDFVLLTSAKYLIICNSTFSWWAAWLNENNIVIAPQGWHHYNSNRAVFSPADIKGERFIYI